MTSDVAGTTVPREKADAAHLPDAVHTVQHLAAALHQRLATAPGNVVSSPYSVAVALAMTRCGARGSTADEIDRVLHRRPGSDLDAGMNALTERVAGRAGLHSRADGTQARVSLDVANSLWGQRDTSWQPAFLDALARHYGAGMRLVDYREAVDEARRQINSWTAQQTHDRITDIIPPDVLDDLTRLVLVNAIYVKAPWEQPFVASLTGPEPFTRSDGSRVQADMMTGSLSGAAFGTGPGWRAARLPYAGGQLAMTVVVPEESALDDLERSLDGAVMASMLTEVAPVPLLHLALPRWRFRLQAELTGHLQALGMPAAFDPELADFSGMTPDERLSVSAVLHEAFVAVDEEGTEAAAATAVVVGRAAAPTPVVFRADRPFLFVVHDVEMATPLFVGRVDDPTASR